VGEVSVITVPLERDKYRPVFDDDNDDGNADNMTVLMIMLMVITIMMVI
jgi:hypothetical protein